MSLPLQLPLTQMQTMWSSQLNPVLALPPVQGNFIFNVQLAGSAETVINTGLGRLQQGWIIIDLDTNPVTISRSKPFNTKTLTLYATTPCTVSLWVF
jgi:hypothetical protein